MPHASDVKPQRMGLDAGSCISDSCLLPRTWTVFSPPSSRPRRPRHRPLLCPPWVWSHIRPAFPKSTKSTHQHLRTEAQSSLVTNSTWQSLKKPEQINPNPHPRPFRQFRLRGDQESRRNGHGRCRCRLNPMVNQTVPFPLSVNDSPRRNPQGDSKAETSRILASPGARAGF